MTVPTKIEKGLFILLWVLIVALLVQVGLYSYFTRYYQKDPIVYDTQHPAIVPNVVHAGDVVTTTLTRCAKDDYRVMVSRTLTDSLVYTMPLVNETIPKGCHTVNRVVLVVPQELPSAQYTVETTISIRVHWLWFQRTDTVSLTSQPFFIE